MTVEATAAGPAEGVGRSRVSGVVSSTCSERIRGRAYPVFAGIFPEFADTLASLRDRFLGLLDGPVHEIMALVFRLRYAARTTVRSRRFPVPGMSSRS